MADLRTVPRRAWLAVTLCALALPAAPAAHAQEGTIPLTAGWEYRHDPGDQGLLGGWQNGGPADGWAPVSVPHVLDARPLAGNFGGTVAWYRLRLTAPPGTWAVRFGQARRQARVWLNGVDIGGTADPYTPFELPMSGLDPAGTNTLVVRVDNRKRQTMREGWWNWGGLTRAVELVPDSPVRLRDLGLMPVVRCSAAGACSAAVLVDGTVSNDTPEGQDPRIAVTLTSPSGVVTAGEVGPGPLAPGARQRARAEIPVAGPPELWAPERPQLYDARVELRAGGRTLRVQRLRIGLRSVRVKRGMLTLNGRVLRLRGASIQEDAPGRGPALTDADIEQIVTDLKALGADVTRAHYALDERLLRRLDEEGILVWNQAPVYHADRELKTPAGRAAMLGRVQAAVLAARNHPSVLTHSVANELAAKADERPGTRSFLLRAARLTRDLDPTRPVALDILSYPRIPRQRVYAAYDVLGINNYFGWYPGKPRYSTRNLADLEPYLRRMHRRYRRHAMVMTEFGAEALHDGDRDRKGSYGFQADYLSRVLDVVDRNRFIGGAIYWTLREFAVKPGWDGGVGKATYPDGIHKKALIAYDGTRKPAWNVARERFAGSSLYVP